MIVREAGTVVETGPGWVSVRVRHQPGPACRGCTACRPIGGQQFVLRVEAENLAEGDEVIVEVPLPSPWRAIALVFGLPLVALVVGLAAGGSWTGLQELLGIGPEAAGILLGGILAVGAFSLAALEDRRLRKRHRPRVVEVCRHG